MMSSFDAHGSSQTHHLRSKNGDGKLPYCIVVFIKYHSATTAESPSVFWLDFRRNFVIKNGDL